MTALAINLSELQFFEKAVLKLALRKAIRQGKLPADAISFLNDTNSFGDIYGEVKNIFYVRGGKGGKFIEWIKEHYDEVIKIVLTILLIFIEEPKNESPVATT